MLLLIFINVRVRRITYNFPCRKINGMLKTVMKSWNSHEEAECLGTRRGKGSSVQSFGCSPRTLCWVWGVTEKRERSPVLTHGSHTAASLFHNQYVNVLMSGYQFYCRQMYFMQLYYQNWVFSSALFNKLSKKCKKKKKKRQLTVHIKYGTNSSSELLGFQKQGCWDVASVPSQQRERSLRWHHNSSVTVWATERPWADCTARDTGASLLSLNSSPLCLYKNISNSGNVISIEPYKLWIRD